MANYSCSLLACTVILVLGIAALSSGCSSGQQPAAPVATTPAIANPGTTAPSPVSGDAVTISNFAFSPDMLTVKAGTTVTWTNKDTASHTVTSDNGVFGSETVAPGGTYQFTFAQAGTFAYHCSIHPFMQGTVLVQP